MINNFVRVVNTYLNEYDFHVDKHFYYIKNAQYRDGRFHFGELVAVFNSLENGSHVSTMRPPTADKFSNGQKYMIFANEEEADKFIVDEIKKGLQAYENTTERQIKIERLLRY